MVIWKVKDIAVKNIVIAITIVVAIIYLSFENYLLFHSLVELFSIVIAFGVFIIVINTTDITQNNYFVFLGVAYAFIGGFDLLHTLAYKGLGVFPAYNANLATQLWVIARYLEAISLLLAFRFMNRKINKNKLIQLYLIVTVILLLSLFYWGIFPDCFIPNLGLTQFKIISEYVIILILFAIIILLRQKKDELNSKIYSYLKYAIIATILSEVAFTLYLDVYGLLNMLGHLFKLLSFYLIYKAIIESSFKEPYTSLFNELRTERDKLKHYFEVSGVMIINIDQAGEIVEVNKKSCEVLGYSKDEIIGKHWRKFVNQAEAENTVKVFASAPKDKFSIINYGQNEIITKSGAKRKILWTSNVLKDKEGNIKQVLSSGLDITDYESLKKELEYNKLQVEFFANLSHELKTPLNLIFSALQVSNLHLKNNCDEEKYNNLSKYNKIIKQNSQRLLRLVNNLIDITKIDTNAFDLNLKNVDIVKVVRKIMSSVENYIETKERRLSFDSKIEQKIITCDPFSIERIMLNLFSNAIKFTEPGDEIRVNLAEQKDMILISVRDSGIGIPKEKQDLIFERFRQIDKSFTRNAEGSGIGLTIVKLLVDLHEGKIIIDSKQGEFTEFKILLPKKKINNELEGSEYQTNNAIDRIEVEFSDLYNL